MLVLMFLMTAEEVRVCVLYYKNYQGEGDAAVPFKQMLGQLYTFCKLHWVHVLFWSYLFTAISCIIILVCPLETALVLLPDNTLNITHDAVGSSYGRRLRGGNVIGAGEATTSGTILGSLGGKVPMEYAGDHSSVNGALWFMLFMSTFLMMP